MHTKNYRYAMVYLRIYLMFKYLFKTSNVYHIREHSNSYVCLPFKQIEPKNICKILTLFEIKLSWLGKITVGC